jgi:Thioredoxin-like
MRVSEFRHAQLAAMLITLAVSGCARDGLGYDPQADPFAQLRDGQATAAAEDKLILIVAGGEWCIWCHYLDAFLDDNPDVSTPLKDTFVVVKTYVGEDNENDAFFSTMPEAAGYPHFWVLAADGTMLASEGTLPLEDGDKSYDKRKFAAFIDKWKARLEVEAKIASRLHAPKGLI